MDKTINALKMMIAPVVFFSITASISGLTNVSGVGKIGGKMVLSELWKKLDINWVDANGNAVDKFSY